MIEISEPKSITRKNILPLLVFICIVLMLFLFNAFPALYGDEYDSLFDSQHLKGNIHAIGYFIQLLLWSKISQVDWFLRLLSIFWFGLSLYWLKQWLDSENISERTRNITFWFALLNPFLWVYAFQIRFYAMFFATSILFVWRFRAWERYRTKQNLVYLVLSLFLLITSHLFGFLVVATVLVNYIWKKSSKKLLLTIILILLLFLPFFQPVRQFLVTIVYRFSNPYAQIPEQASMRGISLGMIAKIPYTLFNFILGERVYPLWLWLTVPATIIIGILFVLGVIRLKKLGELGSLAIFMLINIPLMYLLLDPLAPAGLQGASSRYLIYVLPFLLLILAEGTQFWRPSFFIVLPIFITGLIFLAVPQWSADTGSLVNWPKLLDQYIESPIETCIIIDGRAAGPVSRYSPKGTKIVKSSEKDLCLDYSRILVVTDDFRLYMVRGFDELSEGLTQSYVLNKNITIFPAQITVFDKSTSAIFGSFVPSRLDLPEHDLMFPLEISNSWEIQGFSRLDSQTPSTTIQMNDSLVGDFLILTNYLSPEKIPNGTPVFSVNLHTNSDQDIHLFLLADRETSQWNGECNDCNQVYSWTKTISLVGSYYYPGAYQQYIANIWGYLYDTNGDEITAISIDYLLPSGTGYFYGIHPTQ